jgi:hypothetical protein
MWRTQVRQADPNVGRDQGTPRTMAWSNTRDAGDLLGVTARLHPQLRGCIEALGVGDGKPRWVTDALVIRASSADPQPLWGELMQGPEIRLRLALVAWAKGLDLATISVKESDWGRLLAVEHARKQSFNKFGQRVRDAQYDLKRNLPWVREKAAKTSPANPDPRSSLREELYGPEMSDPFEKKYRHLAKVPQNEDWYRRLGWTVMPPKSPHTTVAPGLLSQGWHLVAPSHVLGWMVALSVLPNPKELASKLGERHLGLKAGFRSANRAAYFSKLSQRNPDLATLTLQRNILWALAELEVVPPTITDAGVPIQSLMVGNHNGRDCCVLISGDYLRLWYRTADRWDREPAAITPLHPEHFRMATLGDDAVTFRALPAKEFRVQLTVRDLQLHTFSNEPWKFPACSWTRRTRLNPRFVIPTEFLDKHGERRLRTAPSPR